MQCNIYQNTGDNITQRRYVDFSARLASKTGGTFINARKIVFNSKAKIIVPSTIAPWRNSVVEGIKYFITYFYYDKQQLDLDNFQVRDG